jgi:flagellar biosynthetic protein FliS
MDPKHAARAYREASFDNAPPIKIVRMLYEGALRYIDRAHALHADRQPAWTYWVGRADAIVEELRVSIDRSHAPELAEDLERLYDFAQSRLSAAVAEQDSAALNEARTVLAKLLEGWSQVETRSTTAS